MIPGSRRHDTTLPAPPSSWLTAVLFALVAAALGPTPSAAQVHLGPQLSLASDTDFGLGGRLVAGVPEYAGFEAMGSFDLFFPDAPADYWEINGNVLYNFEIPDLPSLRPYAGGGLHLARVSSDVGGDTDLGLNLLAGNKFPLDGFTPFAELRVELGGGEQFVLTGGVLFP